MLFEVPEVLNQPPILISDVKFNEVPKSIYSSFPSKVHIPALSEFNFGVFTNVPLFVPI